MDCWCQLDVFEAGAVMKSKYATDTSNLVLFRFIRRHPESTGKVGESFDLGTPVETIEFDCNECKHKLRCLIEPECYQKFESK